MPRVDASNLSLSPLRNRIRHQLLPLLQSYNPGVVEALLRTASIASDEYDFLDRETQRLWGRVVQKREETIILEKREFLALPPTLQRHLLRVAIEELSGDLKDIEARHIEAIMDALAKPAGRRLDLPGGLLFSIEYDRYLLGRDREALCPFPELSKEYELRIPGETRLPGWCTEATFIERGQMADRGDEYTAYFDLDRTGNKMAIRSRQRGDRFQPLGMREPKKVGEFMINAKIPSAWRQRIPIVFSPRQILWVVGYRIDDGVKVTEKSERVLCLKFERIPGVQRED
jgi:tRNA(Ile)-lysidine synthase